MNFKTTTHINGERRFSARMGGPFTVLAFDPARDEGWCRIHPRLSRLPGGRLVLSTNIHGDIGSTDCVNRLARGWPMATCSW